MEREKHIIPLGEAFLTTRRCGHCSRHFIMDDTNRHEIGGICDTSFFRRIRRTPEGFYSEAHIWHVYNMYNRHIGISCNYVCGLAILHLDTPHPTGRYDRNEWLEFFNPFEYIKLALACNIRNPPIIDLADGTNLQMYDHILVVQLAKVVLR